MTFDLNDKHYRALWLDHSCEAGQALLFQGNPPFESATPHMFFVLGALDDESFLMVHATSSVETTLNLTASMLRRHNVSVSDVTVRLKPGSYNFITKDSIIDCSSPWILSKQQLLNGSSFSLLNSPPGDDFFIPLLSAWNDSPFTPAKHRAVIREQWAARNVFF